MSIKVLLSHIVILFVSGHRSSVLLLLPPLVVGVLLQDLRLVVDDQLLVRTGQAALVFPLFRPSPLRLVLRLVVPLRADLWLLPAFIGFLDFLGCPAFGGEQTLLAQLIPLLVRVVVHLVSYSLFDLF